MFKRIDHIELVTDQIERTIVFYTEVLGFRVKSRMRIPQSPMGVPMDLAYLELGGTMIEVMCYDGAQAAPAPKDEHLGYRMMAVEVEDMGKAIEYLNGLGIELTWGPLYGEGFARAEIVDPNGFSIELRHWSR